MTPVRYNEKVYLGDGKHYFYLRPDVYDASKIRVICAYKTERWYGSQSAGVYDWHNEKVVLNVRYEDETRPGLIEKMEALLILGGHLDEAKTNPPTRP